jgi:hypothetical protein
MSVRTTISQITRQCLQLTMTQPEHWREFRDVITNFWHELKLDRHTSVVLVHLEDVQLLIPGGNPISELRFLLGGCPQGIKQLVLIIAHPLSHAIIEKLLPLIQQNHQTQFSLMENTSTVGDICPP